MVDTTQLVRALRIGDQGRLVIPVEIRRALGLSTGDRVVAWLEGDRLILRSRRSVEQELWALFQPAKESLAEDLIQERRNEGARDPD